MLYSNKWIKLFKIVLIALIMCLTVVIIYSALHNEKQTNRVSDKIEEDAKLKVIRVGVTNSYIYDYLRVLRGDTKNLYYLTEEDTDVTFVSKLDMIVYTDGVGIDAWLDRMLNNVAIEDKRIIKLSVDLGIDYRDYSNMSLTNAIQVVNYLSLELAQLDLDFSDFYNKNAQSYIQALEQLKSKFQTVVDIGNTRELVFSTQEELDRMQSLLAEFEIGGVLANEENKDYCIEFRSNHNDVKNTDELNETYLSIMEQNVKILNKALNQ